MVNLFSILINAQGNNMQVFTFDVFVPVNDERLVAVTHFSHVFLCHAGQLPVG
jgi:hypothetical protein